MSWVYPILYIYWIFCANLTYSSIYWYNYFHLFIIFYFYHSLCTVVLSTLSVCKSCHGPGETTFILNMYVLYRRISIKLTLLTFSKYRSSSSRTCWTFQNNFYSLFNDQWNLLLVPLHIMTPKSKAMKHESQAMSNSPNPHNYTDPLYLYKYL